MKRKKFEVELLTQGVRDDRAVNISRRKINEQKKREREERDDNW